MQNSEWCASTRVTTWVTKREECTINETLHTATPCNLVRVYQCFLGILTKCFLEDEGCRLLRNTAHHQTDYEAEDLKTEIYEWSDSRKKQILLPQCSLYLSWYGDRIPFHHYGHAPMVTSLYWGCVGQMRALLRPTSRLSGVRVAPAFFDRRVVKRDVCWLPSAFPIKSVIRMSPTV